MVKKSGTYFIFSTIVIKKIKRNLSFSQIVIFLLKLVYTFRFNAMGVWGRVCVFVCVCVCDWVGVWVWVGVLVVGCVGGVGVCVCVFLLLVATLDVDNRNATRCFRYLPRINSNV